MSTPIACTGPAVTRSRWGVTSLRNSASQPHPTRSGAVKVACPRFSRRLLVGGFLGSISLVEHRKAASAAELEAGGKESFLKIAGDRGPLATEEAQLLELRRERERLAQQELQQRIEELEARASSSQGNALCATPFGVDVVGITEFVALLGALIGGISARQRKDEVERLNSQLRSINQQLRRQARAGTTYAPGLTYVPPSVSGGSAVQAVQASAQADVTDDITVKRSVPVTGSMDSTDGDLPLSKEEIEISRTLKEGKRLLKEKNGSAAMVRFEKALMLSRSTGDKLTKRRAYRGLAASEKLNGQYRAAIKHNFMVLDISEELGDNLGDADVYGSIADLYTELNDFDNAAKYYDLYISEMRKNV